MPIIQLTTDGHAPYLGAVEDAFGAGVDCAMLVKHYGEAGNTGPERKYSPGICTGATKRQIEGNLMLAMFRPVTSKSTINPCASTCAALLA